MKKYMFLFLLLLFPINIYALDTSKSSIVMDMDSGRVLYQNNMNDKRLIASITKIMTALVVLENNDVNRRVKVGKEVLKMYGSNIYIEVGEKITVKDLLYGMILRSGNDAALVLAINTGGNEKRFVKMMNTKAKEIGMRNTIFKNPHGLDEENINISTAYDMAKLSSYIYNTQKLYRKISGSKEYKARTKGKTYIWTNRNEMLSRYKYSTGGKTGYTPKAGRTLVTTASKDKLNLTVVTLHDDDQYNTHEYLYEKIFNKYKKYNIVNKNNFKINKKLFNKDVYIKENFSYPLTKKEKEQIKKIIKIDKKGNSQKRDQVGVLCIELNNKIIKTIPIYIKKKKRFLNLF